MGLLLSCQRWQRSNDRDMTKIATLAQVIPKASQSSFLHPQLLCPLFHHALSRVDDLLLGWLTSHDLFSTIFFVSLPWPFLQSHLHVICCHEEPPCPPVVFIPLLFFFHGRSNKTTHYLNGSSPSFDRVACNFTIHCNSISGVSHDTLPCTFIHRFLNKGRSRCQQRCQS